MAGKLLTLGLWALEEKRQESVAGKLLTLGLWALEERRNRCEVI